MKSIVRRYRRRSGRDYNSAIADVFSHAFAGYRHEPLTVVCDSEDIAAHERRFKENEKLLKLLRGGNETERR